MAAQKWTDLDTLISKTERLNALKKAINIGSRNVSDEDIYLLAVEGYTPDSKNIRLLIENRITLDDIKNSFQL